MVADVRKVSGGKLARLRYSKVPGAVNGAGKDLPAPSLGDGIDRRSSRA